MNYDMIYPSVSGVQQTGENFRLYKVNTVLSQLEQEHVHYEKVRKKYARVRSFFHTMSVVSGTMSVVLTGSGVATSLTGPGIIIGVPLSAIGGLFGLISASSAVFIKKLTTKISKHERTIQLIKSKENTINEHVSKALTDNQINDSEFELIMDELNKYNQLRIRFTLSGKSLTIFCFCH